VYICEVFKSKQSKSQSEMTTLIEKLEYERDGGYYDLRQFCDTLTSTELIQVREWWNAPTTNHFEGWKNVANENKIFFEYLKDQISLKRGQEFLARLNQKIAAKNFAA
jgi:hypothetical protein